MRSTRSVAAVAVLWACALAMQSVPVDGQISDVKPGDALRVDAYGNLVIKI